MLRNHVHNANPEPETFGDGAGGAGGFVKLCEGTQARP